MALKPGEFETLSKKVNDLDALVKIGFIVLVVMVAGLILSAVIFEIQTINDSNK